MFPVIHRGDGVARQPTFAIRPLQGFTLLEMLIVVALMALLLAIAVPSYQRHIERVLRSEARAQLLQAAQFMQRFHAATDSYAQDRAGGPVSTLMPATLMQSPAEGQAIYRISFAAGAGAPGATDSTVTATDFRLVMAPVAGGRMATDACGGLTIDSLGRRGITGGTDAELIRRCWR